MALAFIILYFITRRITRPLNEMAIAARAYAKGDVLNYESKLFLNNNASELKALAGKVYELPSMHDVILEFTRLGVPADKQADVGINGYGVAPSTTQNRTARFTSGTDCPFLIEEFHQTQSFYGVLGDALGMAVPAQYREYVGGSTYEKDGKEYLKVIGETYDGEVYTGQLHVENGTPIVYTIGEGAIHEDWVPIYGEVITIPGTTPTYETTVTNSYRYGHGYELPSTGGLGGATLILCGLVLMAGSLVCGYVITRKRERGRRE